MTLDIPEDHQTTEQISIDFAKSYLTSKGLTSTLAKHFKVALPEATNLVASVWDTVCESIFQLDDSIIGSIPLVRTGDGCLYLNKEISMQLPAIDNNAPLRLKLIA